MSRFEFANDWNESIGQAAKDLAQGKLPGKLGVLQDVVSHWAIPPKERGWVRYGKAAIDTIGTLYSHHQEQQDSRDEGSDPAQAWLKREGFERAYPVAARGIAGFVRRALDGVEFRNTTVKDPEGRRRGNLISFSIGSAMQAYFVPGLPGTKAHGGSEVGLLWDGPFVRVKDRKCFAEFVRERVWEAMGTTTLVIASTGVGNLYTTQIELTPLNDAVDYVGGRDPHNDVDSLASRCRAFLGQGMARTILFHGPPGTGKSTLARALARTLEARSVIVDHEAVRRLNRSVHLIIRLLAPGVLILNDIDRGEKEAHRALLQALETEHAGDQDPLLTCLTVNDITQLDPALLRPGRVHEVREVLEPSDETVKLILDYYLEKLKLQLDPEKRRAFLAGATGFSPADIREFCEVARAVGVSLAIEEIARIHEQRKFYAGTKCQEFNAAKTEAG